MALGQTVARTHVVTPPAPRYAMLRVTAAWAPSQVAGELTVDTDDARGATW